MGNASGTFPIIAISTHVFSYILTFINKQVDQLVSMTKRYETLIELSLDFHAKKMTHLTLLGTSQSWEVEPSFIKLDT